MSERFASPPSEAPWEQLDNVAYDDAWSRFEARFGFRASMKPEGWPAIREPHPSITFDLSKISDGAERDAAYEAINAEALRSFVCSLGEHERLLVLDWQHPAYWVRPAVMAMTWKPDWPVPVYPDGDYFTFLVPDMTVGTFGHPWEQSLCVFGAPLVESLGRTLATWLPVLRRSDG